MFCMYVCMYDTHTHTIFFIQLVVSLMCTSKRLKYKTNVRYTSYVGISKPLAKEIPRILQSGYASDIHSYNSIIIIVLHLHQIILKRYTNNNIYKEIIVL